MITGPPPKFHGTRDILSSKPVSTSSSVNRSRVVISCSLPSEPIGYKKPRDYVQLRRTAAAVNPASTCRHTRLRHRTAHNRELSRIRVMRSCA